MTRSDTTRMQLAKRTLIRLSSTAHTVQCESGTLWITQDGDRRDIVLEAGQQFRRNGNAATIVYALASAELTVQHRPRVGLPHGESRSARHGGAVGRNNHAACAHTLAME